MPVRYWAALVVILGCSAIFPLLTETRIVKYDSRVLPASFRVNEDHYSNILPGDYVGAETCGDCHDEQYDLWFDHPHRKMNQWPTPESVIGDFDGGLLELPTGKVRFSSELDADRQPTYFMSVYRDDQRIRHYQVTRTVGSRYIQSYIGKQLDGPEPPGHDIYEEHKLPYSWRLRMQRWLPSAFFNICCDEPLEYGQPLDEAIDGTPPIKLYREICKNCHNTIPYAYRMYSRPLVGFRDATIAGAPDAIAARLAEITGEAVPNGKPGTASVVSGFIDRMDPDQQMVSLGIGCESCHLGGREHVEHERKIRFLPTSGYIRILAVEGKRLLGEGRDDSRTLLGTCTQCHSGNNPVFPNGAAKGNSREALDLHAGHCATQLGCVTCHEPHTASRGPSGGPDLPAHINSCLNCHSAYRDPERARIHSGHAATASVSCLDCHMPRYTRGVDTLIRTHRISHPVEAAMIQSGSANACNTCHLDKSTRWTLHQMDQIWGKKIEIPADSPVSDQLDVPIGDLWLASSDSHLRLMAAQLYARSPLGPKKLASVMDGLNDPERVNRVFAVHAVTELLDIPAHHILPVDILQSPDMRKRQIQAWLRELSEDSSSPGHSPGSGAVDLHPASQADDGRQISGPSPVSHQ